MEGRSSAEIYGRLTEEYGVFEGCPIAGMLGDQQASLVGNRCIQQGTAKITYGTGCFLLYNTGEKPSFHNNGLLKRMISPNLRLPKYYSTFPFKNKEEIHKKFKKIEIFIICTNFII